MRRIALLVIVALTGGALAGAEDIRPDGKGDRPHRPPLFPTRQRLPPLTYHGGPVLRNPTIYYIWYGTWTPADQAILETLASHLGGSPYANILTTYYDFTGQPIPNTMTFGGSATDDYSLGRSLSDLAVQTVVQTAITNKSLPLDPNGIYFVLTADDVNETSGLCTKYCGWHRNASTAEGHINIALIGNPARCGASCGTQTPSPNEDPGADAAASIVAHELDESISDPFGTGWYDVNGDESADKCAYTYGETTTLPNGALANMQLGGLNFLIQENWVNLGPGHCAKAH
ncbi:MAG: hypothetical protein ABSH47_18575 [Bryobacteraceae bacterium]|jgi:hypothetical protein